MEPSSIDETTMELHRALAAARREDSYLPLHDLARIIAEHLEVGEHLLFADLLVEYEAKRLDAEIAPF